MIGVAPARRGIRFSMTVWRLGQQHLQPAPVLRRPFVLLEGSGTDAVAGTRDAEVLSEPRLVRIKRLLLGDDVLLRPAVNSRCTTLYVSFPRLDEFRRKKRFRI